MIRQILLTQCEKTFTQTILQNEVTLEANLVACESIDNGARGPRGLVNAIAYVINNIGVI
jgi:hypothetical protein